MKIAIASDDAGIQMKEKIKPFLKKLGHEVKDFVAEKNKIIDYPEFTKVVKAVTGDECERGILFCGTGLGLSIELNKNPGIRAVLCYDVNSAKTSREKDDTNTLVLGVKMIEVEEAKNIIAVWLETDFSGRKHTDRIEKIREIERNF